MVKYFACLFVKKRFQCVIRGVDLVIYFARLYITNIFRGLRRCKNLTKFSLFVSYCYVARYCLKCFVSFILRHP